MRTGLQVYHWWNHHRSLHSLVNWSQAGPAHPCACILASQHFSDQVSKAIVSIHVHVTAAGRARPALHLVHLMHACHGIIFLREDSWMNFSRTYFALILAVSMSAIQYVTNWYGKVALHTISHLMSTEVLLNAFPPLRRVVEFRARYC